MSRRIVKYTLVIFLALLAVAARTQDSMEGLVTDGQGQPLPGVTIRVFGKPLAETNAEGRFIIECPEGPFYFEASKEGYRPYRKQVSRRELDKDLRLTLQPVAHNLQEITVESRASLNNLRAVEGTAIYAAKKNEVIRLEQITANLATNNSRQVYNKVSGLNIWESDGSGIQLDIGGRGLSPSRTANFNTRQNGYDISADALGYPESYYTPPTEALEKIEVVRGAASLQYGTQFGGMLNFVMKHGGEKPFHLRTRQTLGSFGLFNSFTSIGGAHNKSDYFAFVQYKTGNGWRPNSDFRLYTAFASYRWLLTPRSSLKIDLTRMEYTAHQPGGLTDKEFAEDPRQSNRARNWFHVDWNLAAATYRHKLGEATEVNSKTFLLYAGRDALGFLGPSSEPDPATLKAAPEYRKNRDLLSDLYFNLGNETRIATRYTVFGRPATVVGGFRLYQGHADKKQGYASSAADADFTFIDPTFPGKSSFAFVNSNAALFLENLVHLSEKVSLTPGIRFEYIDTRARGTYRNIVRGPDDAILQDQYLNEELKRPRSLVIGGLGLSWKTSASLEVYSNISQNYRSITFNDFRIDNPGYRVDPQLQDERGYNFDLGLRGGRGKWLAYDLTAFYLYYGNRIGLLLETDRETYSVYRYRTNIGQSRTLGLETLAEVRPFTGNNSMKVPDVKLFANLSLLNGRYFRAKDPSINGKKVELVPDVTCRAGIEAQYRNFNLSWQYSYVNDHYSDATNAVFTSNAVSGIIPSYRVMDLSAAYKYKRYKVEAGCNNLLGSSYFTRRATGYPGPGIIPADGRSFYLTLEARF